jgi:hypothetical protein
MGTSRSLLYGTIIMKKLIVLSVILFLQGCIVAKKNKGFISRDDDLLNNTSPDNQQPLPPSGISEVEAFRVTVYNTMLRNPATGKCLNCHRPNGNVIGLMPYLAHDDVNVAYNIIKSGNLINLSNPSMSRLVTKVLLGHNNWSGNANSDALAIQGAVQNMVNLMNGGSNQTPIPTPIIVVTPTPIVTPIIVVTPTPTPIVTPIIVVTPTPTPIVTPIIVVTPTPIVTPAATGNALHFYNTVYSSILRNPATGKCLNCHRPNGTLSQIAPYHSVDDPTQAYAITTSFGLVNLANPSASRLATKVGEGHFSWTGNPAADAATVTASITQLAALINAGNPTPTPTPVGTVIPSADPVVVFTNTVYNNVIRNTGGARCLNCHRTNGTVLQIAPFFATDVVQTSYDTSILINLVNISNPAASRLVTKVAEGHQSWTGNPANDSAFILAQIQDMAAQLTVVGPTPTPGPGGTSIIPNMANTAALTIAQASGTGGLGRVTNNIVAFYDFKTGTGNTIVDKSGVSPALDLTISGDVDWLGGQGIQCNNGKAQASSALSKKLHDEIVPTGKFTVEAWIIPDNNDQEGPARAISYSSGTGARNFTFGAQGEYYNFRNRNGQTGNNGSAPAYEPQVKVLAAQPGIQHVVMTYDGTQRKIYFNGVLLDDGQFDNAGAGVLTSWNTGYNFLLCNETSNNRMWQGQMFLAAVYKEALTGPEVVTNYNAGYAEKKVLSFDISTFTNPGAKLDLTLQMIDGETYSLYGPTLSGLSGTTNIKNLRIVVNGVMSVAGQGWATFNQTGLANGTVFSSAGTIVGATDVMTDTFALAIEQIGTANNVHTPVTFGYEGNNSVVANPMPSNKSSLKTFDQIFASLSNITGVPMTNSVVEATYATVKDGLPSNSSIDTFSGAHQINLLKLSYDFCDQMVINEGLRNTFFGNLNTDLAPATLFNATGKAQVSNAIVMKAVGSNIANQPSLTEVQTEVHALIDELVADDHTNLRILKGACVLGTSSMGIMLK